MSCLFNSIGKLINLSGNTVRKEICDYLEKDLPIIDGMKTSEILDIEGPQYIMNMRNSCTMGGAIEIQSACNIWNAKIIVHNIRDADGKKIEFTPFTNVINILIEITWNGGHYEAKY